MEWVSVEERLPNSGESVLAFPRRLQKLREQQRKSRAALSELCGLMPDAVRRYERGDAKPTLEALIKLADYFEVSLDYLTGRAKFK